MAALQTYSDVTRKEDVSEEMMLLSAQTTQLVTGLAKTTANSTYHEWQVDADEAAADNANVESADYSSDTSTQPTRSGNFTQIFKKSPQVSDTEQSVQHYGMQNPMAYQVVKKLKSLKYDMELAVVRGTGFSGNATVARRMNGIMAWITTNATTFNSGTTMTEAIMNDLIEASWTQGGEIDEIYCGSKLKRRISTYTGNNTRYMDIKDSRLVSNVDVYESDFGVHKIFKHRYVQVSGDTTANILLLDSKRWKIAYLVGRAPFTRDIAKTGDSVRKELVAEATLECHQEKANAKATGLLIG